MHSFNTNQSSYHARAGSLFNSFAQSITGTSASWQGVPTLGILAWWNPAFGITTMLRSSYDGALAVANWSDMSGNYHLQATVPSQGNIVSPPRYITAAASTYNSKPYLYFDGSAGQFRNLTTAGRTDDNWLARTATGFSAIYAASYLSVVGQNTQWINTSAGGFYYDNSVQLRAYAPGVPYPYKSVTQPALNTLYVFGHHYNAATGQWWYSVNYNWKAAYYTDAAINRNTMPPYNIYNNMANGFLQTGSSSGEIQLFDILIYNRPVTESEYKLIYEYIKNKYCV